MSGPKLVAFRGFSRADQISQRFVRRVRDPDRGQIARAVTPRQFEGIPAIRLDAIAGLHGD